MQCVESYGAKTSILEMKRCLDETFHLNISSVLTKSNCWAREILQECHLNCIPFDFAIHDVQISLVAECSYPPELGAVGSS